MIEEILEATGIEHNELRFLYPPSGTYAVWLDSVDHRGSDQALLIKEHAYTIELYSSKRDYAAEKKIETELMRRNMSYEKQEAMWLNDEKLFMIVYNFDYIEKRRMQNG